MKKISKYIALLLLAIIAVSCSDNENWTIVTDIQPGVYITGDATVYSNEAPASALQVVTLDGDVKSYPELIGIYTWLKAGGSFDISIVTELNNSVKYGKGEELVNNEIVQSYTMQQDGPSFSMNEDGLYHIVVNTASKEINILPVTLGVIGAATPNGWNGETPLGAATFDEASLTATWTGNLNISPGEYKFRYSGDWGYSVDYDASTEAKLYTDLGIAGEDMGPLTSGGFSDVRPGGANITTEIGGEFEFTIKYSIRTRNFQATYKVIGDPIAPPEIDMPSAMYIIGSPFDWNWDNAKALTPVHGFAGSEALPGSRKSMYWGVQYFNAGDAIKFNFNKDWDGNDFGYPAVSDEAIAFADIKSDDDGNIKVGKAGWYIVTVTTTYNEDETGVLHSVDFLAPDIYLIGNTIGSWDPIDEAIFTVPETADGEFVSPEFVAADELRISAVLEGIDWWKTEFIILDGKIEYRGNGDDQERVKVSAGQQALLNFSDGTGKISGDAVDPVDPIDPEGVDLPSAMYVVGTPFGWDSPDAKPLTPVHGFAGSEASAGSTKSMYWMVQYFDADDEVKFNFNKDWDGNEFGVETISDDAASFADITDSGGNIKVGKAGWYIVTVTTSRNEEENGLEHTVDFHAPNIYLLGDAIGTWDIVEANKFTVPAEADGQFVSPAFIADEALRMCVKFEGIDWWKSEFNIYDGMIEFRGNGGDQDAVNVVTDQKAYLNFSDGTGEIK